MFTDGGPGQSSRSRAKTRAHLLLPSGAQVRDQNQDLTPKTAAVKTPIVSHHLFDGQPLSFVGKNSQVDYFQIMSHLRRVSGKSRGVFERQDCVFVRYPTLIFT